VTHWSDKSLEDMTPRDWRIVREDNDIYVKGKRVPNPIRGWEDLSMPSVLRDAIRSAGYKKPSPIQMQGIAVGIHQRDIIGVAETGSGKTAAFLIPLLLFLFRQPQDRIDACSEEGPLAVIMGPTRELVQQIGAEARKLAGESRFRTVVLVGGNSVQEQVSELRRGCQIVAATPGRLLDCLENRYVVFNQCSCLVLDEADRMIDMGFEQQVDKVLSNMAATAKSDTEAEVIEEERRAVEENALIRVTIMFSATMSPAVERMAQRYMRFPVVVRIGDVDTGRNARITQHIYFVSGENRKKQKLLSLVRETSPPIIVFANSKRGCDQVATFLLGANQRATVLHSGKVQSVREANLEGFKSGRYDILIATDVAGRGLDISDVAHVINYEMATDIDRYTHRIGRTGRAGKSGLASTILTEDDSEVFVDLVHYLASTGAAIPKELANHRKSKREGNIQG